MLATSPQKQSQTPSLSKKPGGFFFQPKLTINQPNAPDGYRDEQEADTVADKVMRMPIVPFPPLADNKPFFNSPTININKTGTTKEEPLKKEKPKEETQELLPCILTKLSFDGWSPPADDNKANDTGLIQRNCAHCEEKEEKKLQQKEMNNGETITDTSTENYIGSLSGKGRSLSQEERNFFEPKFGYDFSNVKIHTDPEANESAHHLSALAYTHNNHIVFGSNQHQPQTDAGKKLMAHELTHVVQNKGNANNPVKTKDFSSTGRANEDTPAIINAVVVKSNMLQKYVGLDRIKAALLNSKNFNIIQKYELEEYGRKCKQGSNLDSAGGFFCRNVQDAKDKDLKGDIFAVRYLELAYVIHEFMHKLSGLTVKNVLGTFINEGVTQYFTDLFLAEGKYDILTDHGYMDNLSCANKIVSKTDEDTVAKTYFNNDMKLVNDLQKLLSLKSFNDVKPYFDTHQCIPSDL
jgi:hypothetical protein